MAGLLSFKGSYRIEKVTRQTYRIIPECHQWQTCERRQRREGASPFFHFKALIPPGCAWAVVCKRLCALESIVGPLGGMVSGWSHPLKILGSHASVLSLSQGHRFVVARLSLALGKKLLSSFFFFTFLPAVKLGSSSSFHLRIFLLTGAVCTLRVGL